MAGTVFFNGNIFSFVTPPKEPFSIEDQIFRFLLGFNGKLVQLVKLVHKQE